MTVTACRSLCRCWLGVLVVLVLLRAGALADTLADGHDGVIATPTNTTPCKSVVDDDLFPGNLFSNYDLRHGAIIVNLIIAFYGFCTIALVCENYFLPSVQVICEVMKLPPDVAAATFMSVATSAPELFVNVVSIFMTESTMGVGTTVGSATFNVLGIATVTGLASIHTIQLNWRPVVRDSLLYGMAVTVTTIVVWDGSVEWYEALAMVLCSITYLVFMFTHHNLARWARNLLRSNSTTILTSAEPSQDGQDIATISISSGEPSIPDPLSAVIKQHEIAIEKKASRLKRVLRGLRLAWWLLSRPVALALRITIPDCRKAHLRRFFFATFLLCIVWIALSAYIVTWMVSIMGQTFGIPDAVMGITFLAAGGSMPEAISAIIMARVGVGSMGISNGLGANTLNILMNLGMPWLVRSLLGKGTSSVLSDGLAFDFLALMLSVVALNVILLVVGHRLNRTQGVVTLCIYLAFMITLVLNELNVFRLYVRSSCSR